MKKVIKFSSSDDVQEQAAEWLVRMDSDDGLNSEEFARLQLWLAENPLHSKVLKEFAETWEHANILTELAIPIDETPKSSRIQRRTIFQAASVAACAVFAVVVATSFGLLSLDRGVLNQDYLTKIGELKSYKLSDGTQIQLNTDTKVSVRYSEQYRDVFLSKGEAHFDVAKQVGRPFRVFAANGRINAVGTAFSVYLSENEIDVTVSEGRVSLARLANMVNHDGLTKADLSRPAEQEGERLGLIRAGESAQLALRTSELDSAAPLIIDKNVNLQKRLAWTEGVLQFSGEPLSVVVQELGRYTTDRIEFDNPELAMIRIGGRFPTGEADIMLAAIESNVGLKVTRFRNGRVVISEP